MDLNHILYYEMKAGERALKSRPKRRVRVIYIYPEPNDERDTKVLKELAQYFAKKIQQSSTR